jgi:RNA polymerase sigma-70 factor, ECF subfamily
MSLAAILRATRPDLDSTAAGLDAILETAYRDARRAEVPLSAERFVAYVAARLPEGDVATNLAALMTADLYLACACAEGAPGSIPAFERAYEGEIDRAFRRFSPPGVEPSDVRQLLRTKLWVGGANSPPKITEYAGRGPLRVWVRVTLARMLQNLTQRAPKEVSIETDLQIGLAGAPVDPELMHIRELYRRPFEEAFAAAIAALPLNDRVLLHQRFVQRVPLHDLAISYGVHVNTIARWLARARQALESTMRAELASLLHIGEAEFTSILRLVQSQLDISLGALVEPGT